MCNQTDQTKTDTSPIIELSSEEIRDLSLPDLSELEKMEADDFGSARENDK